MRRASSGRRPVAAVLAAGVAALVVSGCAAIPTSGPVVKTADDGGLGESTVRYSPARPTSGASPREVVRGYLDAMLAYPVSSGTAAAFLTPRAARTWSSAARVRIYSRTEVDVPVVAPSQRDEPRSTGASADVRLGMFEDARLDRQGHYTRLARETATTYRLERVDGEWRIANPQAGLLVDRKFFDDYYRPFDLFYFDRPGRRLVPDPVHLPVGEQLATALVTGLARGPVPAREGTPRTYVPKLPALRPAVPVEDDGVADVDFSEDFGALGDSARNHLSAQIVWTLRQVPGITAVRLVGGTTSLSIDGTPVQPIDSWRGFGPGVAGEHAYAIKGGKVVQMDGADVEPLGGAWGKDSRGAQSVSVGERGVAGVGDGGSAVRVTNRNGTEPRTFRGTGLITPRWDDQGHLWLVDRAGDGTRVRLVDGRSAARTLDIGRLAGLDVTTFTLSPDGSRYAVSAGPAGRARLFAGRVLRDAQDQILGLGDPVRVFTTARGVRSPVWSSGTELTFLAESAAGVQIRTARIDGSETLGDASGNASLPDVDAQTLVLVSGETPARYATDVRGRLWYLTGAGVWKVVGTRFTALTNGR